MPAKRRTRHRNHRQPSREEHSRALGDYAHKRDFGHTPEPRPQAGPAHQQPIFVVQEHHASRLHYDFRLEAQGVLKSWAVPKQLSMDPAVKRLAVQVEDHPLAYADFSGMIPEGQYGAGLVILWDRGTYENLLAGKGRPQTIVQEIEAGHLEVRLHGDKLRGNFALIRMRRRGPKQHWLLIKMRDEASRSASTADHKPSAPDARRAPLAPGAQEHCDVPRRRTASPTAHSTVRAPRRSQAVVFTNTDKLMFPEVGITKAEVLSFYERIAERLLPHLRDRPATLERLPEGIKDGGAPHFWQKHTPSHYPAWIPRVELPTEDGRAVRYVLVNDRDTLLYLVNQGTLTFHVWLSRVHNPDRPDVVLFDLDPDGVAFTEVVAVAKRLHKVLRTHGVEAFVKTSGKRGLHVLAPWEQRGGYAEAREWARRLAEAVVAEAPDRTSVEPRKAKRRGKVYVDVLQNARGHHVVPLYVLRAVPQAGVSTPLAGRQLRADIHPQDFTLRTILRRLARQRKDPFAPLLEHYRRQAVAGD